MKKQIVAVILKGHNAMELSFTMLPLSVQAMLVHWRRTGKNQNLILSLDVKNFADEELMTLLGE